MNDIKRLLADASGIQLDIGCGANKQGPDWVGLDVQKLPGVDIIWDINIHPWEPLPDACAIRAVCSHLVEHIPPVAITEKGTRFPFVEFMDEVWRILKPDGQFAISCPHGASPGMLQDPTHINFLNENTWLYFDPLHVKDKGLLYKFYRPKPWKIAGPIGDSPSWDPTGNMEVILIKRREDKSYYE